MRSPAQPAYADQQEQPIVKMAFFLSISWIERGLHVLAGRPRQRQRPS